MVWEAELYPGYCKGTMIHMTTYNTEEAIPHMSRNPASDNRADLAETDIVEFIKFNLRVPMIYLPQNRMNMLKQN